MRKMSRLTFPLALPWLPGPRIAAEGGPVWGEERAVKHFNWYKTKNAYICKTNEYMYLQYTVQAYQHYTWHKAVNFLNTLRTYQSVHTPSPGGPVPPSLSAWRDLKHNISEPEPGRVRNNNLNHNLELPKMQTPYKIELMGCFNLAIYRRLPKLKCSGGHNVTVYSIALHLPNNHQIFQLYNTSTLLIFRLTEVIAMVAQLTCCLIHCGKMS